MEELFTKEVTLLGQESSKDLDAIVQRIKDVLIEENLTLWEASRVIRAIKTENNSREIDITKKVRETFHKEVY